MKYFLISAVMLSPIMLCIFWNQLTSKKLNHKIVVVWICILFKPELKKKKETKNTFPYLCLH